MSLRYLVWASVILAIAIFLTACGGGSDDLIQPTTLPPTSTPILAATATSLPSMSDVAEQPESSLATPTTPESPLDAPQPESPLGVSPDAVDGAGCALDLPAPSNNTGVVCGGVTSESPSTKYLLAGDFYLAPVIYTKAKLEDGKEIDVPFVSLNVGTDKIADIKTETGGFVFLGVPPGEYSVVIYTPIQSFLFHDGTGENTLMFTVEAGEIEKLDQLSLE
jgi:hypothetical protein